MSGNYLFVGVSHMVVNDDFSGVVAIVKWLSYVPKVMVSWGRQHLKFTQNCCIKMFYFVLFVNKFKPSKVCGRQHLKLNDITSNFLKAVFHKFYLDHSWIYCLNYALYECVDDSSSWSTQHLWVAYCPVAVSLLFFLPVLVSNIKTPWIFLLGKGTTITHHALHGSCWSGNQVLYSQVILWHAPSCYRQRETRYFESCYRQRETSYFESSSYDKVFSRCNRLSCDYKGRDSGFLNSCTWLQDSWRV